MAEIAVGVAGVVLGGLALYKYNMPTITTQSQFGRLLTADTAAALPEAKVMHDPRDSVKLLQDSSKLWQIPYAELTFSYLLGKGSQGEVFRGIWRGAAVAIKRIDTRLVDSNILEEFCMEADINMRLKHPNLTLFMGLSLEHPYLCIVSEFVQRGSLFDLLRDDESTALTWRRAIYIARDVARGMAYMHDHNPPILHRDLKSLNILVTKQWTGKIADFGMTRFAEHGEAMTQCGSPLWMAPEMICNQAYDQKADVFSFAICLWELYTHQIPYRSLDLSPSKVVYEVVRHNLRPEIPASCPQRWVTLLECCWAFDAKDRPTFSEIAHELEDMLSDPAITEHVPPISDPVPSTAPASLGGAVHSVSMSESKSEPGIEMPLPSQPSFVIESPKELTVIHALPPRASDHMLQSRPERALVQWRGAQFELVKHMFDHNVAREDLSELLHALLGKLSEG